MLYQERRTATSGNAFYRNEAVYRMPVLLSWRTPFESLGAFLEEPDYHWPKLSTRSLRVQMRVILHLLFLLLIFPLVLRAQTVTVKGYVEEAGTGERLAFATVYDTLRQTGTSTNEFGFFSLPARAGLLVLQFSYVGYASRTVQLDAMEDTVLVVSLVPVSATLREVVVSGTQGDIPLGFGQDILTPRQIRELPALLGESDVLKALQHLPGVRSGTEGTSGMYVRGGSPDQNLILLDGAPVYHAAHLFGFLSTFNPDAIQSVRLTKGGFPARYGGRLSSVIDIDTREGNLDRLEARIGISPIVSRLLIDGPIRKGRSSFLLSGRRTFLDVLMRPFLSDEGTRIGAYFYDVNGKLNHIVSPSSRVYASFYAGRDRYFLHKMEAYEGQNGLREAEREGIHWRNVTGTIRWTHIVGRNTFLSLTSLVSSYHLNVSEEEEEIRNGIGGYYALRYRSGIRDIGIRLDVDIFPDERHTVKTGIHLVHHVFRPGATHYRTLLSDVHAVDTVLAPSDRMAALEGSIYVEDELRLGNRWHANVGVHGSIFGTGGRTYRSVQPRLSVRYALSTERFLNASFSTMKQYIHLLASSGVGMPTDLWLPTTERISPERATQVTLGYAWDRKRYTFRVEGSFKSMDGLLEYREGASFLGIDDDWQNKVLQGTGLGYGIEILLQKRLGRTTGWVAYTLSKTTRSFPDINEGRAFPYRYDRRHDFNLALVHLLSNRRSLSIAWVYGSGDAVTIARAWHTDQYRTRVLPFYPSRGNVRTPSYHRLDLSYRIRYGWRGAEGTLSMGVYNAYGRKNPFYLFIEPVERSSPAEQVPPLAIKQISLFRFIPAMGFDVSL